MHTLYRRWKDITVITIPGVILPKSEELIQGYGLFKQACNNIGVSALDVIITCGREGKHSKASRHYIGLALDFRIRSFDGNDADISGEDKEIAEKILKEFNKLHTGQYLLILEPTHFHLQYQGYMIPSGR